MEPVKLIIFFILVAGCLGFLYYISVTRLSLTIKALLGDKSRTAHIYWIYTNSFLIWLTDRKFLVSALLLFNYNRMVTDVVRRLNPTLEGKTVLQASCAFGDLSIKIAERCVAEGAKGVVVCDVVENEVRHTRRKLRHLSTENIYAYGIEDVTSIAHLDNSFDYVVIFFLFHELPLAMKSRALKEAARVLKPGGTLVFGEFHRPTIPLLRMSGYCFFKVMEPYAHEMWGAFDAEKVLSAETSWKWEFHKETYLKSNYQVFTAIKAK